jgi:prepilin-type N-terminal cleavage/methylation domain-containing protein
MRGATLVELMVVLAIIGLVTGMSALAAGGLRPSGATRRAEALGRARATAIRTGRAVTLTDESGATIRFLPDGRGIGRAVDPFTGDVLDARQ